MLAIHGIWAHGVLSLWAEDSDQLASALTAPRIPASSRKPVTDPRPHPYTAGPGQLADVFAEFGEPVSDIIRKGTEGELTLWLPTTAAGQPVARLGRATDLASGAARHFRFGDISGAPSVGAGSAKDSTPPAVSSPSAAGIRPVARRPDQAVTLAGANAQPRSRGGP